MGSVLRWIQERKRKKCFGEVEIIGREGTVGECKCMERSNYAPCP